MLREGPVGSAWFAHFDRTGAVAHVDVRGPTYKGSLTGGAKSFFRLSLNGPPLPRLVLTEAAIDALSIATLENLRGDTLYAATGGGMGPGTIAALEALLVNIAMLPGALFCSATDANGQGIASPSGIDRSPNNRGSRLCAFGLLSKAATGMKSFALNRQQSFGSRKKSERRGNDLPDQSRGCSRLVAAAGARQSG